MGKTDCPNAFVLLSWLPAEFHPFSLYIPNHICCFPMVDFLAFIPRQNQSPVSVSHLFASSPTSRSL